MRISRLRNLTQEAASSIAFDSAGENAGVYAQMLNNLHNGVEVAVLKECGLATPHYNIAFADGSLAYAVPGKYLG